MKYFLLAYAIISALTLILYVTDKIKAKCRAWRIPERVLLSLSLFGGAVGGLIGMLIFRHKTRHWYFWAVNFIGLALQGALLYYVYITI